MSDNNDNKYPELDPKEVAKRLEKEKGLVVVDDKGRSLTSGKFVKGAAKPGPGRPKKVKTPEVSDLLTDEDRKAFLKDGKVHSKAALQRLLETAQTRAEAVKIASLLIQYDSPKLSAIETKSTEERSISITWSFDKADTVKLTEQNQIKEVQELTQELTEQGNLVDSKTKLTQELKSSEEGDE